MVVFLFFLEVPGNGIWATAMAMPGPLPTVPQWELMLVFIDQHGLRWPCFKEEITRGCCSIQPGFSLSRRWEDRGGRWSEGNRAMRVWGAGLAGMCGFGLLVTHLTFCPLASDPRDIMWSASRVRCPECPWPLAALPFEVGALVKAGGAGPTPDVWVRPRMMHF